MSEHTVAQVLKAKGNGGCEIWDLSDAHTVGDAFEMITKHNAIQAVPIYRLEPHNCSTGSARHSHSKCYYGILTARELIKFILGRVLVESASNIKRLLISELGRLPDCRVLGEESKLREVIEAFKRDPVGVLVQRDSSYTFLAPIDVLRYMHENKLIGQIELAVTPIDSRNMTVKTSETAKIAFSRLVSGNHNALAVVDVDQGMLLGNISLSDFFLPNHALEDVIGESNLKKPLKRYTADSQVYLYHGGKEGLEKMLSLHIHQLWMVDADSKPTGTVTISNILHKLA